MANEFGGVVKKVDNVRKMLAQMAELTGSDVLVGVPAAKSPRRQGAMSNAELAYIHNFGSPSHNIPARPFMSQGVKKAHKEYQQMMKEGAKKIMNGQGRADIILNKIGMMARNKIVEEITDPAPPFVPLQAATVRARLRRTAAGRRQLKTILASAQGTPSQAILDWASGGNAKPLIDTGQLRRSISYVVRKL